MAKDFFDDEYEKQQQQNESQRQAEAQQYNTWYNAPAPESTKRNNKPLYIVLLCLALVACIGFGWLLCAITQSVTHTTDQDADNILSSVVQYMQENYYRDIPEDEWITAIEASGTALMQYAGDRFCQLMSPQTYYDFCYPAAKVTSGNDVFGMSYLVEEGIGLYVSSITADTPAFGQIQEGDIILKLSDMKTKSGEAVSVDGVDLSNGMVLGEYTTNAITQILQSTYSATFHVLRADDSPSGYTTLSVPLRRAAVPVINSEYNFEFVEFYFGKNVTNVSTSANRPQGATTEQIRCLDQLPAGAGYVRIKEFMDYVDASGKTVSASDEFHQVMTLFKQLGLKRLVLDLRGNPGGNVQYVSEIAAMLVTDARLTAEQKATVTDSKGQLLITYLDMPKPAHVRQNEYHASSYSDYFGEVGDKCDIVVWTNESSASASELLTGCLRDYGTAMQMGTTTYGKGIAQTWQELPFEGDVTDIFGNTIQYPWAVYYTCASYFSPLGNNIHGSGYTPPEPYDDLTTYEQLWTAVNSYWD